MIQVTQPHNHCNKNPRCTYQIGFTGGLGVNSLNQWTSRSPEFRQRSGRSLTSVCTCSMGANCTRGDWQMRDVYKDHYH